MCDDKRLIGIFGVFQNPNAEPMQGNCIPPSGETAFRNALDRIKTVHKNHLLANTRVNYIVRVYAR